jgi:D-alanyl-D-alanine carboxypeptidase/D-alanyl-D-alanine-endopeptidase (penicillin-binding protein 4)
MSRLTSLILAFFFCISLLHSASPVYKEVLGKRLDYIFKDEKLKKTKLGVSVFSLSRAENLYELNANEALAPASAIKILTAYVALKKLGNEFTFKTEAYSDGKISNGVLKGDLYLKGGGDPALVTERMYLLVEALLRWDFKKVEGNIFVDDSIFSTEGDGDRIIDNALDRPYNAPVNGLSFNYNTTTVYFRPGLKIGDPVRVLPEPSTGLLEVVNHTKTVEGNANNVRASRQSSKDKELLVVEGSLGVKAGEQRSYFNISQGALYAGHALKLMLSQQGVQVTGTVKKAAVPTSAKRLVEFESLPLRELVLLMNKFSNNFMADSMVKMLGLQSRGSPGSLKKGLEVIREEATLLGINRGGFNMNSGSGLSRESRISAGQFILVLNDCYKNFAVFPELMSSLPIAAVDGTLRKRMKDSAASRRLRGKTGTIFGVSSLVGVVQSKGGELLAYAVMMNDNSAEPGSQKMWQNYLGQALSDFNRQADPNEVEAKGETPK